MSYNLRPRKGVSSVLPKKHGKKSVLRDRIRLTGFGIHAWVEVNEATIPVLQYGVTIEGSNNNISEIEKSTLYVSNTTISKACECKIIGDNNIIVDAYNCDIQGNNLRLHHMKNCIVRNSQGL